MNTTTIHRLSLLTKQQLLHLSEIYKIHIPDTFKDDIQHNIKITVYIHDQLIRLIDDNQYTLLDLENSIITIEQQAIHTCTLTKSRILHLR